MSTLDKIQNEILALPYNDKVRLSSWLAELDGYIWDNEIEKDFEEGGRGKELLDKVKNDFLAGKCSKWD
ncbi:MAG: hypothetical protein U5L00_13930 [Desulfovermiculus sp.]|nr:hypothetical protein [Desulfovermiculus sp.]